MSRKKRSIVSILKRKAKKVVALLSPKKQKRVFLRMRDALFPPSAANHPAKAQKKAVFSGIILWKKYGWLVSRITIIAFFIGFNIALGKAFIAQNQIGVPIPIATMLLRYGIIPGEEVSLEKLTNPYQAEIVLEAEDIVAAINEVRRENELQEFTTDPKLATAAAVMLSEIARYDYDLEADGEVTPLATILEDSGYAYLWVHNNALVGPLSPEAVVTAWLSDDDQAEAVLTPEFVDIGLAVAVVDTPFMGKAGVIVQLLAQPQPQIPASVQLMVQKTTVPTTHAQNQPKRLAEFSDEEVVAALNAYRATHGVHPLSVNGDLCTYAQKRVGDLIAFGSLDGHAGFIADFEAEDPPVGIISYGGGQIGENLASQYCIDGSTGNPIYAEHPTQLIEWCFDSSQKGHREAQLSKEYDDVCVRHGENMYVVIFGDRK